jgi:hypothetical protein
VRTTNQNLIVNILTVTREVIDDAKRYIPHPTFCKSLLRNVTKERTLLINPATNIMIDKAALILIEND